MNFLLEWQKQSHSILSEFTRELVNNLSVNGPFPSYPKPLFHSEVKCEAIDIIIIIIVIIINYYYYHHHYYYFLLFSCK